MKKLLCLLGGALLILNVQAQEIKPLYIDSRLPNITFPQIIHYKDSAATIQDFQGENDRLVIFDFWFTACTDCIAQFPKEISLQKKFDKNIQIVLITDNPKGKVLAFLDKWQKSNHIRLDLPVVVEDTLLGKYVRHLNMPHYAWIAPDNRLIGQTTENFINLENIRAIIKQMAILKKQEAIGNKSEKNK